MQIHDKSDGGPRERAVTIAAGSRRLEGILSQPPGAQAVIAFAHGSGSGRLSPRNQYVARVLQEAGMATLLLDLLEADEADDRRKVFDIELLADRLLAAADWLALDAAPEPLRLGYFGASTGAAAALVAAARQPENVGAVVSRGGRPDLAEDDLPVVAAPTLLIVGGGAQPPELVEHFVELAGGPGRARIAVLPMASGSPRSGPEKAEQLRGLFHRVVLFGDPLLPGPAKQPLQHHRPGRLKLFEEVKERGVRRSLCLLNETRHCFSSSRFTSSLNPQGGLLVPAACRSNYLP